ncbi:MAG: hemolysin family protein [bacterium]|nr:hemolysin family protein [bacterium]
METSVWLGLATAAVLVLLNGFFVAAEFALVKVRGSRLQTLVDEGRPFATIAKWLADRLDSALSACQIGITMASLALGWVGEPAFARILDSPLHSLGLSESAIHTIAFLVGFSVITGLHLVIGEQAPKIFAIRKPEIMTIWCAAPLLFFYCLFYPLVVSLNFTTALLLRMVGVEPLDGHDSPHTEDEIRALMAQAHMHGELTRTEVGLLNAVFEFDDMVARQIMLPRSDTIFFDADQTLDECISGIRETKHSRYPVVEKSLDDVIGILHIKDVITSHHDGDTSIRNLVRPVFPVPESMAVGDLLKHFQNSHQLLSTVVDEYGTVIGIVTLENVLERIVGAVEDEFDAEKPLIEHQEEGEFIILGGAPLDFVERETGVRIESQEADTLSGALTDLVGRIPEKDDQLDLADATLRVLEIDGTRASRILVTLKNHQPSEDASVADSPE